MSDYLRADMAKIRAKYAHYGTPKRNTCHADVIELLDLIEELIEESEQIL